MNLDKFKNTDVGVNSVNLYNIVSKYNNAIFVDLGVRHGISSMIMMIDSEIKKNKVFGVDVSFHSLDDSLKYNTNYEKILGDSVTVGKYWTKKINGLFIDTFHIKEQVLSELYFWYPHIEENGFIAFHDTNWPEDKRDIYGGIKWDRVEDAVKSFFGVDSLNYEDDYIKMSNYPESWGMTIVEIKKKKNYIEGSVIWKEVFEKRNELISIFWNEENKGNVKIDLNINV
jgi:cephalosporin hydroxylase